MTAQRKAIRQAMQAAIVAASTAAGGRVFTNRSIAYDRGELPLVNVLNAGESVEEHGSGVPLEYERDAEINVVLSVEETATADDELDDLAGEVEQALLADETLGGTTDRLRISRVGETQIGSSGDVNFGFLVLGFTARYHSVIDTPDPAELQSVHVEYETGPDNDTPEAVDDIDLVEVG